MIQETNLGLKRKHWASCNPKEKHTTITRLHEWEFLKNGESIPTNQDSSITLGDWINVSLVLSERAVFQLTE